jgi:hypothetical protein
MFQVVLRDPPIEPVHVTVVVVVTSHDWPFGQVTSMVPGSDTVHPLGFGVFGWKSTRSGSPLESETVARSVTST